jgi:hypothetical protein
MGIFISLGIQVNIFITWMSSGAGSDRCGPCGDRGAARPGFDDMEIRPTQDRIIRQRTAFNWLSSPPPLATSQTNVSTVVFNHSLRAAPRLRLAIQAGLSLSRVQPKVTGDFMIDINNSVCTLSVDSRSWMTLLSKQSAKNVVRRPLRSGLSYAANRLTRN